MIIEFEKSLNEYFMLDGEKLISLEDVLSINFVSNRVNVPFEVWTCVNHGFSQYYASNFGNILRAEHYSITKNGSQIYHGMRFPKYSEDFDGYYRVNVANDDGKYYDRFVHRLVLLAFKEPASLDLQVNHMDGNKKNNHLNNLEWCTCQENIHHYYTSDVHALTRKRVHKIRTNRVVIHKNDVEKYVDSSKVDMYLANGWRSGHSDKYKQYMQDLQKQRDDVIVYKGNKEISIDRSLLSTYLEQGYEIGRKIIDEKCHWMNNGSKEIQIPESQQDHYLSEGWVKGRLLCNKSRWMYKDDHVCLVDEASVDQCLAEGYKLGRPRLKFPSFTFVVKDGQEKRISLNKLDTYIQAGWLEGFLTRHWMHNKELNVLVTPEQFQKYKELGFTCGVIRREN